MSEGLGAFSILKPLAEQALPLLQCSSSGKAVLPPLRQAWVSSCALAVDAHHRVYYCFSQRFQKDSIRVDRFLERI